MVSIDVKRVVLMSLWLSLLAGIPIALHIEVGVLCFLLRFRKITSMCTSYIIKPL